MTKSNIDTSNANSMYHATSIGLGRPVSAVWLAPLLLATALAGGCGESSTSATTSSGAGGSTSTGTGGGGTGGQGGMGQGGSAGSSGCLPANVQDDFAGAALDTALWKIDAATGMTIEVVDQHLTFTPAASFDNTRHAVLRTANTFNLTGCATWVEVLRTLPQDIPGETFWVLTVGADNVIIRVNGTAIQFQVVIAGKVTETMELYDAVAHRWWRMREADGVIYLETSPNGDAWTEQLQQSHSLDLSAVRSGLVMHTNKITGAFEGPQFDNVNVLP